MPTYVIGDVQGCYQELVQLLQKINFNQVHDRLWFCGDLINRGPNSLKVIEFIMGLGDNAITVLGNHDLHYLGVSYGVRQLQASDTLAEILNSNNNTKISAWLRNRPLIHHSKEFNTVLVHAGILPTWDLVTCLKLANLVEQQLKSAHVAKFLATAFGNKPNIFEECYSEEDKLRFIINAFTRMRYVTMTGKLKLKQKGNPGSLPKDSDIMPWYLHPQLNIKQTLVFGHWAALNGKCPATNILALDTGAVWGGKLTAYCLETKDLIHVESSFSAR